MMMMIHSCSYLLQLLNFLITPTFASLNGWVIPAWHPDIQSLLKSRTAAPSGHPSIHQNLSLASSNFNGHRGHPNCDSLIASGSNLPGGHPNVDSYLVYAQFDYSVKRVTVPWWHPDIDSNVRGKVKPPAGHPSVHQYFAKDIPSSHPNIDAILANPNAYTLPSWHLPIDPFVGIGPGLSAPLVILPADHPDVPTWYMAGTSVPAGHPKVQSYFQAYLPSSHPNIDTLLANTKADPIPKGHPSFSLFLKYLPSNSTTSSYNSSVYTLPANHPNVKASYAAGIPYPTGHPKVQGLIQQYLPSLHPNLDAILSNPKAFVMPTSHPNLDILLKYNVSTTPAKNYSYIYKLPFYHPNIQGSYLTKTPYPSDHPKVQSLIQSYLPDLHPNIDAVLSDPNGFQLPIGHPSLDKLFKYDSLSVSVQEQLFSIPFWHPNIMASYKAGIAAPDNHILFYTLLQPYLPPNHPNIDSLIRNPNALKMPANHPDLTLIFQCRGRLGAGHFLSIYLTVAMTILLAFRFSKRVKKYYSQKRKMVKYQSDGIFSKDDLQYMSAGYDFYASSKSAPMKKLPSYPLHQEEKEERGSSGNNSVKQTPNLSRKRVIKSLPAASDLRSEADSHYPLSTFSSNDHLTDCGLSDYDLPESKAPPLPEEKFAKVRSGKLKDKKMTKAHAALVRLFQKRIPRTELTYGNVAIMSLYVFLNILALFSVSSISLTGVLRFKLGFGSLAAANTFLLILPATRNSILIWFLGLPFDHVIVYHRWLGRWTICLVLVHFALFFSEWTSKFKEWVYLCGTIALAFSLFIFITSLEWIRRKHFNLFFYSHFSFIGFLLFAYLHLQEAQLFIIIAVAIYGYDRILRTLWAYLPSRTIEFRTKGKNLVVVRFRKNPLNTWLQRHKVGQYFFINFPTISMYEWHPFSVSSGPMEDSVEVHIRALGDYTKSICNYAKACSEQDSYQPWIRFDGPYGNLDFNFRRYNVLLLAAGGIGITPIMGMLKDIFFASRDYSKYGRIIPHRIESVLVIWAVPNEEEATIFKNELLLCHYNSMLSQFPELEVEIFLTKVNRDDLLPRGEDEGGYHLNAGRPDFTEIFSAIQENFKEKSVLSYACGRKEMVQQIWDNSISLSKKGQRVDFYHETFEF